MGSKTVNPVTPLITGASLTKTDTGGTTSSIVITATTAQSVLDFSKLSVVVENYNTTTSCVVTVVAGDNYSGVNIGNAASITVSTASNVIIGGENFESARFQDEDNYANLTITTAATAYVYAIMHPFGTAKG